MIDHKDKIYKVIYTHDDIMVNYTTVHLPYIERNHPISYNLICSDFLFYGYSMRFHIPNEPKTNLNKLRYIKPDKMGRDQLGQRIISKFNEFIMYENLGKLLEKI